jgi:hypothetical protein
VSKLITGCEASIAAFAVALMCPNCGVTIGMISALPEAA